MDSVTYALEDQKLMSGASNYFDWQARLVLPWLGSRVLEVGCGTGNFTRVLLDREAVISIDREPRCVEQLRLRYPNRPNIHAEVCGAGGAAFVGLSRFRPDSCVCLNVLEHIEDDAAALAAINSVLPAGGVAVLIVPAFQALYGPIDRNLGHRRRYSPAGLRARADECRFSVEHLSYMNIAGFFGWWLNARLLRREYQSAAQIAWFDRYVVPYFSRLENALPPPFGQSLLAVLRKGPIGNSLAF